MSKSGVRLCANRVQGDGASVYLCVLNLQKGTSFSMSIPVQARPGNGASIIFLGARLPSVMSTAGMARKTRQ